MPDVSMSLPASVLQVIPELDAGGAERTTVEIAAALVAAGGRATVASAGGRLASEIEAAGGRVVELPVHSKNPTTIWRNGDRLAALAREVEADIIHVRSRAPAWSCLRAARKSGARLVSTYHGAYNARGPIKRLYNSGMVRGDIVIANSAFTAAAVAAQHAKARDRIKIVPRGADLERFDPAAVDRARREAAARAFGWLDDETPASRPLRVLTPGRLTAWKAQSDVIEAAAILARISPTSDSPSRLGRIDREEFTFILCGDSQGRDDYRASLQELIASRGVADTVKLADHYADMPAAYAVCDVVLTPSRRPEAFGRVAVEAGAMGRPVVAAAHGGALETIVDGETGRLTPPGDPAAIARILSEMRDMGAARRAQIGDAARSRVVRNFSTKTMCEATLLAYKSLLA